MSLGFPLGRFPFFVTSRPFLQDGSEGILPPACLVDRWNTTKQIAKVTLVPSYDKVTSGQGTKGPLALVLVGTTTGTEVLPVVGLGYEGPLRRGYGSPSERYYGRKAVQVLHLARQRRGVVSRMVPPTNINLYYRCRSFKKIIYRFEILLKNK